MDSIEDICGVIDAFINREDSKDWESQLLAIYGVLQAMFVQQDATKSLADALGQSFTKDWKNHQYLKHIRELRNRSIGHPSDYKATKANPGGHISRPSISKFGMDLMIVDGTNTKFHTVSIPDLVFNQCLELEKIINTIADSAIKDDIAFKETFKNDNLLEALNCSSYYWQKIMEAIRSSHVEFGIMHLDLLENIANEIESAVVARYGSIDSNEFATHNLANFRYDLQ